jgi:uncharacterized protein (AIM24 family)
MNQPLAGYAPAPVTARMENHGSHMLKVALQTGNDLFARVGSMVAYEGFIQYEPNPPAVRQNARDWATGEGAPLMKCSGDGLLYLADYGADVVAINLKGDGITVNATNLLAFDESLQYEVRRVEGHGIPGGALFTMQFQGTGTIVVKTHGTPVVLPVTPTTFADCNAVVAWSAASQVIVSSQVRMRRNAYPGDTGESVNLQFRGAPGNFIVVQPYEV